MKVSTNSRIFVGCHQRNEEREASNRAILKDWTLNYFERFL